MDLRALAQEHLVRLAGPGAVLRDDQWAAVRALVEDRAKVVVVQRTGWGKSAVYWIATGLLRAGGAGPTLVISPLLALMRDQVAAAERSGLSAVTLNSANVDDWPAVEARIKDGSVDVLLISPERLNSIGFRSRVIPHLAGRVGLLVIDEAHATSDWGHDFRPDYRRIKDVLAGLPSGTPVLATTATANARVTSDVADQLGDDTVTLRGPLDRKSLALSVVETPAVPDAYAWIAGFLARTEGSGIVYTLTVAETSRLAGFLQQQGLAVAAYSSETPPEDRLKLEADLLGHRLKALVATSSLGMGLDHPTLAFVLHLGSPASPIAYYQQVGRAGRALDSAQAVLLPTAADENIWAYFDSTAFPPETTVRKVLDAIGPEPVSLPKLETETGLRRTRLEALLKVLDVDGAVARADGGWVGTGTSWEYDTARYEGIAAARKREQHVMRLYVRLSRAVRELARAPEAIERVDERSEDHRRSSRCLMRMLLEELDDPHAADCGRCAVCTGSVPPPPDPALVDTAKAYLRSQTVLLEPRKMWPSGTSRRGRIGEAARPEVGRALALAEDAAWGSAVQEALANDAPVSAEVFDGLVRVLGKWGWPAGRPTWVAWVPSRRHDGLLSDLAMRLAALGRMEVATPLAATGPGFQEDQSTNTAAASLALRRLSVHGDVPRGPVLLLDDVSRSGFTLTVAAALLREAGSGPVYPLVLHRAF